MPKRPFSDESESEQAIKKVIFQKNSIVTQRSIKSQSAEKTLQLLYEGATKYYENAFERKQGTLQSSRKCSCPLLKSSPKCHYCDCGICPKCSSICYNCKNEFCPDCAFKTYDWMEAVCYSCY